MNSLEDMKKKYEELGEAIKRFEEQEQQPAEWPQEWDSYWVGAYETGVSCFLFKDDTSDKYFKAIGDMHRTKEEAEAYRAYRMDPRTVMRDRIQMWVDGYNGGERGVYFVGLAGVGGYAPFQSGPNPLSVKDEEGVCALVGRFGLDNILWACGGPEPGGE